MESSAGNKTIAMSVLDDAKELLLVRGADEIEHPGGTLFDHLLRVQCLLADWDADTTVQLAGLCHACYGTDGFALALLQISQRSTLASMIGGAAEALVYLYGSCDRDFVYPQLHLPQPSFRDRFTGIVGVPDEASLRGFVELTAANELDVVRHNAALAAMYAEELKTLMKSSRHRLSAAALEAWDVDC